jgi:O-antigen/teichoic acid export membrane protein
MRRSVVAYFSDSFRRNALYLMSANGVAALFGFVFWIMAARIFSTEEVGLASVLISAMTLLTFLSRLGFDWGLIRFLPTAQNKTIVINTCFTIASLVGMLSFAIFLMGLNIWSPTLIVIRQNWLYLGLCLIFVVSTTINMLQGQVFIAFRSTQYTFIQNLILGVRVFSVGFFIFMGAFGIFVSLTIANVLALLAGIFFLRMICPGYKHLPRINIEAFKEMFSFSIGNYISSILSVLPVYLMPLLLIEVLNPDASAYYVITQTLCTVIGIFIASSSTSMLAEASYAPEASESQLKKALKLSFLLVPVAILVMIIFGKFILSLYGPKYAENALWLLWILAISNIPATINSLYFASMRVKLRTKEIILVQILIDLIIICAGYPLIKLIGLNGVGFAFLSANTIGAIITGSLMLKMSGISFKYIAVQIRKRLS